MCRWLHNCLYFQINNIFIKTRTIILSTQNLNLVIVNMLCYSNNIVSGIPALNYNYMNMINYSSMALKNVRSRTSLVYQFTLTIKFTSSVQFPIFLKNNHNFNLNVPLIFITFVVRIVSVAAGLVLVCTIIPNRSIHHAHRECEGMSII